MADAPPPAAPAAPKPAVAPAAAAPAAPPKELISPAMKQLAILIEDEQKRLGWDEAKLCAFATQLLGAADPYKKLKITTFSFIRRLRVPRLEALLAALRKAR
ncbi:MAG: hypothetical protein FJ293_09350 [Planctomycetes bacterium]|nr:hypothetical protein [Planctomycetota bacterium]